MGSPLYLTVLTGAVEATLAPKPLIDALTSVEVSVSANARSGFRLSFTLANNSPLQLFFLMAMGAPVPLVRVVLVATFGGLPQVIMDGVVTEHRVEPDAMQGSSHLVVTGEDLTAVMDLTDNSGTAFPGLTPDLRVLTILGKYAMYGIVPNVVPVITPDVEVPTDKTPSQQGTDLAYIQALAREAGYVFYLQPGPAPGISQAYWGPQIKIGVPQPALNVNMDTWTNVESLSFQYRPLTSISPRVYIQEETTGTTLPISIPGVNPLDPPLGATVPSAQTTEDLSDTAKRPPAQAMMLGMARASDTSDVVTGSGTLRVLRYGTILQARQLVGVRGAGLAYDGLYYVDSTQHDIKLGEYKQSFTLKRNALISSVPVVPTMPF